MSTTTTDTHTNVSNSLPAARVSYTLNNTQPVICTIIDSQPLFYMDHEEADTDLHTDDLSDADLAYVNSEINTLQKELNTLEKFSAQYTLSTEEYIAVFDSAKNSILGTSSAPKTSIDTVIEILSQSRAAQSYLDHAKEHGLEIIADTHIHAALYDRAHNKIRINPNLSEANQVLLALHELRRHWQHRNGALLNPMHFHPENAILINRIQKADLIASTLRGAWELQLSGYKDAWQKIENSGYSDLGRAFTREAYSDFRTINNGMAVTAAFEAWFLSERCRATDKQLIRQMLADNQGYVFDIDNDHAALTPTLIAALGNMPYGKNYLAQHIDTIMNDPIFTEVRDRSNANFLWFIKFERSFRETERDLQSEFSSVAEYSYGTSPNNLQGQNDEKKVVVLYDGSNQPARQSDSGRLLGPENGQPAQAGADIIYLRRAPSESI